MPPRSLPARPDISQLRLQAKELRRAHRNGSPSAAARILTQHPRLRGRTIRDAQEAAFSLADAQLVMAREYGFESWTVLKRHVAISRRLAHMRTHPCFAAAIEAFDRGDLERLRALIAQDPTLVRARGFLEPPFGYFSGATLLHLVAGNPMRVPLPPNVVEIAAALIEAGAEVNARTLSPRIGETTMDLVLTSKHASEAGVSGPLIDLLLAHGARLDLRAPDVLHPSLSNHATRAAERLIDLGAEVDVCAAAALGRMDRLCAAFDDAGKLKTPVRRGTETLSERDAIGLAMLFAYVNGRREAVDFLLEKDGNWNMIGVNNGTALHRAAGAGDRPMVERLVAKGADLDDRNNPFNATPLSWADHEGKTEVFHWLRTHCPVDIHDAVCFGLIDHVRARIAERPDCVNDALDQWQIPRATPLHFAAHMRAPAITTLLLDAGAQPNTLAGDGRTALDIAESRAATEVAKRLIARGGLRAAEL
jgi:ankyrin repeat protein